MRLVSYLSAAAVLALAAPFASLHGQANSLRDESLAAREQAGSVSLSAMLISASSEKGESDRRLAAYVPNLKSSLRFETFKLIGEGSARIEMPGTAEITLPRGQVVKIEAAHYGEGMVWLRVNWMDGNRQVMNVVYAKWQRGKPIVTGTTKDGENLAILVTPR